MSNLNKQEFLKMLRSRTRLYQGETASMLDREFEGMQDALGGDDGEKALTELIRKAQADPVARGELAELRVTNINNFVIATANAISFFDTENLGESDIPYIQSSTKQPIKIHYAGQDGGIQMVQAMKNQDQVMVPLQPLTSDDYEYFVRDIYTGDVKTPSMAQVDVAYDHSMQINALLWPLIDSAIGAFKLTGPKHLRTFNPHPSINIKNLPLTNLLTPDGTSANSGWRKECLDAILMYCAAWGTNCFSDGPINPSAIYIPSSDLLGMLKQITLTSFGNAAVNEIFENGYLVNYGGKQFVLVGDTTLDPDNGRAYMKSNKAIGKFFTKTSMDKVIVTPNEKQNKESISEVKVIGNATVEPWRVNVAAIQYRTAKAAQ